MLSVEEDPSLIKHVHKQPGFQRRGFTGAPCTAQGTLPAGRHTKPVPWLQCLDQGSCWTTSTSSSSSFSTSAPAPASPITLHNPRALPQPQLWRRKLPCNLSGNVVHICQQGQDAPAPDRCICKPSDRTQKWSICGREDLSILYFNYFLPAFWCQGGGFPQGDALIQFVLALRWSFQASQSGPKVIKSDMI